MIFHVLLLLNYLFEFLASKTDSPVGMQVSRGVWQLHDENLLENVAKFPANRRRPNGKILQSTVSKRNRLKSLKLNVKQACSGNGATTPKPQERQLEKNEKTTPGVD